MVLRSWTKYFQWSLITSSHPQAILQIVLIFMDCTRIFLQILFDSSQSDRSILSGNHLNTLTCHKLSQLEYLDQPISQVTSRRQHRIKHMTRHQTAHHFDQTSKYSCKVIYLDRDFWKDSRMIRNILEEEGRSGELQWWQERKWFLLPSSRTIFDRHCFISVLSLLLFYWLEHLWRFLELCRSY